VNAKIQQGLLIEHQNLFALRLAQIRMGDDPAFERTFSTLMKTPSLF